MYKELEIAKELKGLFPDQVERELDRKELSETSRGTYFNDNLSKFKLDYWRNYSDVSSSKNRYMSSEGIKLTRGYSKMILTKYIANTKMSDLPKGSVGYYLGNRYTKVSDVKKSMEYYGLEWERSNPELADFFIVGDKVKPNEVELNNYLSKPMVMDDELRVDHYFSVLGNGGIKSIDSTKLVALFSKHTYSNLKMICSLLKNADRDSLCDMDRFRLLRLYVKIFSLKVDFELSNKEHVELSDITQRYVLPQHRYYITNSFLKSEYNIIEVNSKDESNGVIGSINLTSGGYGSNISKDSKYSLPHFEGIEDVVVRDIEDDTSDSILRKYKSISEIAISNLTTNINNSDFELGYIVIGLTSTSMNLKVTLLINKSINSLILLGISSNASYQSSHKYLITPRYSPSSMKEGSDEAKKLSEQLSTLRSTLVKSITSFNEIRKDVKKNLSDFNSTLINSNEFKVIIMDYLDFYNSASNSSDEYKKLSPLIKESISKQLNYLNYSY